MSTTNTISKKRELLPFEIEQEDEKLHKLNSYPDIASKLQVIRQLHLTSVHYEALEAIKELETFIAKNYNDNTLLDELQTHPRIAAIKRELSAADDMLNVIESVDEEWKLVKSDRNWSTEYKRESNSVFHSFRLKGVATVQMKNICAIFNEMDLIKSWMPLTKASEEISQLSLFCKCGYVRVQGFWPLQDRECVMFAYQIDDLKRSNKLLVLFNSNIEDYQDILDKFDIKIPQKESNVTRIDMKVGGMLLEKVEDDESKTKISLVWNVDPKVNVPAALLNFIVGQFAGKMLSAIVSKANKISDDPLYKKRMAENDEFYGMIDRKLKNKN